MTIRRVITVVAVILLLPVLLLGAALVVAQSEWGERWVERTAAGISGRSVEVDDISVKLGWPPRVIFGRLKIGNPEWAQTPHLVDAEGLYARVAVPPLFAGKLVIPYLGARHATAGLELDGERATWRFGREESTRGEGGLQVGLVYLDDGRIAYIDRNEKTDLDIAVKGSAGEGGELKAEGKGKFRGEAASGTVRIPSLDVMHARALEVHGKARVGATEAAADGTMSLDGKALDLKLRLAGDTFKGLSKVTGIVLPDTPPYRLNGRLRHAGNEWVFDPFDGKVGDSDLAGSVTYSRGSPRPLFKANLRSRVLDFDDLGPLVGAPPKTGAGETAAPHQRAKAQQVAASDRVLPETNFRTEAWGRMDADVRLEAKKVLRPRQLPIDTLSTHLVLRDSVLRLQPLNFGMAGGRFTADITLDPRRRPMHGVMKADVQGLQLNQLFPALGKTMQDALGTLYGRIELEGDGYSVATLIGSGDGKASMAVEGGRISLLLVELIGLDVAEAVMLLGRRHQQVELRCAVSGFAVKDGIAQADSFVVDTTDTLVKVEGAIDLRNERLDLETKPYPKDPSPLALRTPLTMKGPFKDPSVRPKPGPIAARVAAAAALAAITPPLGLLALIETGPGKDANCTQLLAEAKQKGAVKKVG